MYFFVCFAVLLISATCQGAGQNSIAERSGVCSKQNMFVKIDGKCDLYTECQDYRAVHMQCPEGLHFNPSKMWPEYPCDYPHNVNCEGRGEAQLPVSTSECLHQYGYWPSPLASPNDCGHFRMCVGGKAVEMFCAPGLAFNPDKAVCDWPSEVSSCNADAYVGFTCPPSSFTEGVPVITNHKYDGDCYAFYSCMNGKARILTCDPGYAFNPASARCEDVNEIGCHTERGQ